MNLSLRFIRLKINCFAGSEIHCDSFTSACFSTEFFTNFLSLFFATSCLLDTYSGVKIFSDFMTRQARAKCISKALARRKGTPTITSYFL